MKNYFNIFSYYLIAPLISFLILFFYLDLNIFKYGETIFFGSGDYILEMSIAKLIIKLGLPIDVAKENLGLSRYIENYPLTSKMVLSQLKMIIDSIKQIKKSGEEYTDIQDHPMVKRHLDKLENFI